MDKKEFLDILRSQLSGQMSEQQIAAHIQYYSSYIEERTAAGNSESEVLRELGDPRLIARTLLDTGAGMPYSDTSFDYEQKSDSGKVKQKSFKLDFSTWYGKLLAILIAAIVLVILFALAVVWISKQGGWKGEGCGGNCASCHSRCENPDPGKKH